MKLVILNHSLLLCDNPNCTDTAHISAIDLLYADITDALKLSCVEFSSEKNAKSHADNQIAGWNEYCVAAHAQARDDFMLWVVNNKPRHAPLFICMKTSRAHFKLCLRRCKAMESRAQADSLARKLLCTQSKQFWKEIKKVKWR